jgi:hypothetical protein
MRSEIKTTIISPDGRKNTQLKPSYQNNQSEKQPLWKQWKKSHY